MKTIKSLHLAVGRALWLNILNMGAWDGLGLGTGIAPLPTHPAPHPGYTLLPHPATRYTAAGCSR